MSEETIEQRTVREALERVEGPPPAPTPPRKSSWLNLVVDYGPLLVFFLAYRRGDPSTNPLGAVLVGTGAFMVATVVALAVSKWRLGKISPMLWLSLLLVLGFGGLTLYFKNPVFIQIKPTIIYLLFAGALFGGLLRGKAMLKYLLEAAFEGLDDVGWRKLSRNWAVWFVLLAIANEVLRRSLSFDGWLQAKLWGVSIASFAFTFAQIPMLLRHGLGAEDKVEVETTPPQG